LHPVKKKLKKLFYAIAFQNGHAVSTVGKNDRRKLCWGKWGNISLQNLRRAASAYSSQPL